MTTSSESLFNRTRELANQIADRTADLVKCDFTSGPNTSASTHRWTVVEFGTSKSLTLAEAAAFFDAWKVRLDRAGAIYLSRGELAGALRAVLYRTADGEWEVATQTMQGALDTQAWRTGVRSSDGVAGIAGARAVAAEHGYRTAWDFPLVPLTLSENHYGGLLLPTSPAVGR